MSKNLTYVGVAVLAVIAVVLGYQIYQTAVNKPVSTSQLSKDTAVSESTAQQQAVSAEQKLAKSVPDPNTPLEERIEFNKKLSDYEKPTSVIEITNCKPSPLISRVQENTDLKIVNNDSVDNVIFVGSDQKLVTAKGSITIKVGKGDSLTNLTCNGGASGLLHVIQV